MKIRKILPLLALALAALFVLAGCDALLESIYPEQTTGLVGTNSLTIDVATYYGGQQFPSLYVTAGVGNAIYSGPLTVELKKAGTAVEIRTIWLNWQGYDPIMASWTFEGLKDDSYTADVWLDTNNDGVDNDGYSAYLDQSYTQGPYSTTLTGGVNDSTTVYVY